MIKCTYAVVDALWDNKESVRVQLSDGATGELSEECLHYPGNLDWCRISRVRRTPLAFFWQNETVICDIASGDRLAVFGYQDCSYDPTLIEVWFKGPDSPEVLSKEHPRFHEILRDLDVAKQQGRPVWHAMRAGVVLDLRFLTSEEDEALLQSLRSSRPILVHNGT